MAKLRITFALIAALLVGLVTNYPVAVATLLGQGYSNANPSAYWVNPGRCNATGSGTVVAVGLSTSGASATPVIAANYRAAGSHTLTFICTITPPAGIVTTGTGLAIVDAVFAYTNTNYVGTQSATLASGTMNSSLVFSTITYPAAGVGEAASTVAPVRADSGTLVIAPVVASFNATTNTAGEFYTIKFTPATPIAWKTDLVQLLLTVTINAQVGLNTTLASSGVLVHFKSS